jgi:hypothetical protein
MTIRAKSTTALLQAVKIARENPRALFNVPGDFPMRADDVLRMWERGVQARASRGLPELTAAQERRHCDLKVDARRINEYIGQRIRNTGSRGLLRDARMQRKYPHINNQPREH